MLRPELIPAISIAIPLAYTAYIWHVCRRRRLVIPFSFYGIFVLAFAMQALMYLFFHFTVIDIAVRGFWVRVSFITLALSFSIPLTILFVKTKRVQAL